MARTGSGSSAIYKSASMQPSLPSKMPTPYGTPFEEKKPSSRGSEKQTVKKKIESMLLELEAKIGGDTSIAAEAVKRSLFGIFAQNY
jgi:hypothetical protein